MTYFDLFDLPHQFQVDVSLLKQRYLQQQQLVHPDRSHDKAAATIQSHQLQQAYQTLASPVSRARYLLELAKQAIGLEQSIHDFEFLQTALELREQLDDATDSSHLVTLRQEVQQWLDGLTREFLLDYQAADWSEARDTVRKMYFFQHILADIDKAEDRFDDVYAFDDFDDTL